MASRRIDRHGRGRGRAWRVALSAIAIVTVAACASADGATTDRGQAPSRADAASAYLALVGPLNARLRDIGERVDARPDLDAMADISRDYADVQDAFHDGLLALDVPAELRDEADAAADAADRVADLDRAAAARPADAQRIGAQLSQALDNQRVWLGRLRDGLGLGPVPMGGWDP
jgi:hypothetical protein